MKTEKEKAAEGLLYNANHDSELQDEMKRDEMRPFQIQPIAPRPRGRKRSDPNLFSSKKEEHRYPIPFPMRLWL